MTTFELIEPRSHDLGGGFLVRRCLPSVQRQAVGPFLFFDHFGPVVAKPTDNHDVRPHPHIGLATVTYLFEGAMMHRDSTGSVQRIEPGAINWMTAGRGIVHSERTPDDLRGQTRVSHGLQLWVALPTEYEEVEPSFAHTAADAIPSLQLDGVHIRVLIGSALGLTSPVKTLSPTLYLDLALAAGAQIVIGEWAAERALYAPEGTFQIDGVTVPANQLAVLQAGTTVTLSAPQAMHVVLVGGEPLGHRHMSWNFVSSSRERIKQAEEDWLQQRFDRVPGETEFIPLPERRLG